MEPDVILERGVMTANQRLTRGSSSPPEAAARNLFDWVGD